MEDKQRYSCFAPLSNYTLIKWKPPNYKRNSLKLTFTSQSIFGNTCQGREKPRCDCLGPVKYALGQVKIEVAK